MNIQDENDLLLDQSCKSNRSNSICKSFRDSYAEVLIGPYKTSTLSAAWNITNIIQGIGILGIPYAILMGSWMGIILNIIAGIVSCSTGKMIIDCMYEKVDDLENKNQIYRVFDDYPDIGAKVWPRFGRGFVALISVIEMFGASTLYLILLGSSLNILFKNYLPVMTQHYWFLIAATLVLLTISIKQINIISWFSLIAIISLFSTIITILIYCIIQSHGFSITNFPDLSWQNIPVSSGIIVFSYCAHPVLPAIETSMKNPQLFNRVMNISFIIAIITKLIFGLIPVFLFGSKINQCISDNITENYYSIFLIVKIFVLFNAFFSLPMLIYVLSDRIDQAFLLNHFHSKFWPNQPLYPCWIIVTRLIIILSILLISLTVPYFALVMSFIGSFTGTNLSFLLPCIFNLKLKWSKLSKLEILYRFCIIIFGFFIGIVGMIFAAKNIMYAK